jgi:hypothetical protein
MTEAQRLADRIETENYEAASMIRRLEAECEALRLKAARWIPVAEQTPPVQERVLAFDADHNIVEVDMWFGPDFNFGYSHWMPLPANPGAMGKEKA